MKLKKNWRKIAKRSWSMQLLGGGVVFSALAAALPFIAPIVPTHWLLPYAVLIFFVTLAAGARLLNQKDLR